MPQTESVLVLLYHNCARIVRPAVSKCIVHCVKKFVCLITVDCSSDKTVDTAHITGEKRNKKAYQRHGVMLIIHQSCFFDYRWMVFFVRGNEGLNLVALDS